MTTVYNFNPGPSTLPAPVLERAQSELRDWGSTGISVMEMSHRSKEFLSIAEKAETDLRELLGVSKAYKVLFLAGGATAQFAAAPLNLMRDKRRAAYVDTGYWSRKAIAEAKRHAEAHIAATAETSGYTAIPARANWNIDPDCAYLHYTANETIGGLEFHEIPDSDGLPLVSDMSSNILSRPLDVDRFGLIYAGAQKNIGPAGLAVVIVREELIGAARPQTPSIFDYRRQADEGSMANTPPTYAWYLTGLVLDWLKQQGGVAVVETRNVRKAAKLYAAIDDSDFYSNSISPAHRSRMNVPFHLPQALEDKFFAEAKAQGLIGLKGHRSVGGARASIYNAMPEEGVEALTAFMRDFQKKWG